MGAVVLIDPVAEAPAHRPRRYALPVLLIAGWGGLFAYCAAYLTEDMPFRPQSARTAATVTVGQPDEAPRRVVVVAAPEPAASGTAPPVAGLESSAPVPRPAPVAPAVAPAASARLAPPSADYVGTWGPTADACSTRSHRRGYIPATLTPDRAKAGRTICNFHDGRRTGNAWVMAAECSDRGRRWSSQVRLVVEGDRLTWSSSRGTSAYVRCNRRAG